MKSILLLAGAFAPLTLAKDLCEQYGYLTNDGYAFNNNAWGKNSGLGD
jgi:xyloglucan-specific endo-beta-1,4-glucanase